MSSISTTNNNPLPPRPNIDSKKPNLEGSQGIQDTSNVTSTQTSTKPQEYKISQLSKNTSVNAPTSTQGAVDIQTPDKIYTPQQSAEAIQKNITYLNTRQLPMSTNNFLALGAYANNILEGGLCPEDQFLISTEAANEELKNPGTIKRSLNNILSGDTNLMKNGKLTEKAKPFAANPRSLLNPKVPESTKFNMFSLLLLLDKLASVSYDTYRQMMRAEQTEINIQFDNKKSETMYKALTSLVMGVGSAAVSIGMSAASGVQAKMAQQNAVKMTLESKPPTREMPQALMTKITNGEKLDTQELAKAMKRINNDPKLQTVFAKEYQGAMHAPQMIQDRARMVGDIINTFKSFLESQFDIRLVDIEKAMKDAQFSQDEARSMRQEANKMEQRANDAAKDIEAQKFQTMKAIASKIA